MDTYINWPLAKDMLVDLWRSTEHAISVCDAMLIQANAATVSDGVVSAMLGAIELTEGQIKDISRVYLQYIDALKLAAATLKQGEINDDRIIREEV